MVDVYQIPENNGNGGIPFSIPLGGGFGGFGNGMNDLTGLFAFAIIASMFGWGNGGFGGFGGGGNGQAAYLANQLNNDSGRELILNAINGNGEASRAAIQNLSTMLGQDYNTVFNAVQNLQNSMSQVAAQNGMGLLELKNSILSGNTALGQQLAQCCCENRLLTTQQGYEAQIRTLEQTNQLGSQADRNHSDTIAAINAQTVAMNDQFCALKERELQNKIDALREQNTQLRGQIDNANQTAQITSYVNSIVAPIAQKVNDIAAKQLPTVPVQYPQLQAINTGAYTGGGMFGGFNGVVGF